MTDPPLSRSSSDLIDAIEREAHGPHNETALEMNGRLQRIIGLCRELRSRENENEALRVWALILLSAIAPTQRQKDSRLLSQSDSLDFDEWRVEWLGVLSPWYRLWSHDDGLYSGGETEGWHDAGTYHRLTDGEPNAVIAGLLQSRESGSE